MRLSGGRVLVVLRKWWTSALVSRADWGSRTCWNGQRLSGYMRCGVFGREGGANLHCGNCEIRKEEGDWESNEQVKRTGLPRSVVEEGGQKAKFGIVNLASSKRVSVR